MARNERVTLGTGWTQLTNADATSITIQNTTGHPLEINGRNGATDPTTSGMSVPAGEAILNKNLSDLFPGVSGANRVYARGADGQEVFVSHA